MNDNEKKLKHREKNVLDLNGMTILVTGSPGFIGANLAERLLRTMKRGRVVSLDNLNDYYDPALKEYRLRSIEKTAEGSGAEHIFEKGSISDREFVEGVFERYRPEIVVHLAAQAVTAVLYREVPFFAARSQNAVLMTVTAALIALPVLIFLWRRDRAARPCCPEKNRGRGS